MRIGPIVLRDVPYAEISPPPPSIFLLLIFSRRDWSQTGPSGLVDRLHLLIKIFLNPILLAFAFFLGGLAPRTVPKTSEEGVCALRMLPLLTASNRSSPTSRADSDFLSTLFVVSS